MTVPPVQTPADLLRRELAADPARPLITFYDDATGERVELSVATFDNWVAKTANLLVEGLAAESGMRVGLLLPLHWQAAVWCVAGWSAGLVVALDDPVGADLIVTGADNLARAGAAAAEEIIALSLRPLGAPVAEPLPPGVLDYGVEVRAYGDRFRPIAPLSSGDPALVAGDVRLSQGELATVGRGDLLPGERVLTAAAYVTWPALCAGLLRPLAAGGSLVLCRNLDPGALVDRVTTERVTVVTGLTRPADWPADSRGAPPRFVPLSC